MCPPMSTDGVLGAAYLPTDGYIDPSQLTFALVEGARRRGAEICEDTRVTGIEVREGRVHRVITDKGGIETDLVVNAGGMFAPEIGRMAGVNVPLIPFAHEYLITRPAGLPLDMPTMRDPSLLVYYRPESGGLIMGGYEREPAPWGLDGVPSDFNGRLLEPDWDRFEPLMTKAVVRTPSLKDAEVVRLVNGPETFSTAGRPLRVSPIYSRLTDMGAAFGEKSGWERVNWFEPNGTHGDQALRPHGWAGRLWSPAIGVEHKACRETAAIFDFTSFAKIEVRGRGAAEYLESLADNRVARAVGALTYTQMLNEGGGIECDFTVTRLDDRRFRVITGTAFGMHDLSWIRDHAPGDGSVEVEDVTSAYACVGLWGPAARSILQRLTPADIGTDAFPFMTAREIAIGTVPCLALRVTYVGELGWELYCPSEFGLRLWDTIWEAGHELGLVAGGYKAVDSLRLEKGYRVWGADITSETDPYQAGLGFCVKLDKGEFIGRSALLKKRDSPAGTKLACLVFDDPRSVALGSEPVRIDGEVVGRVTSGGYG